MLDFSGAIFNNKNDISYISECIETHKIFGFKKINFSHCNLTLEDFEFVCKCAGKLINLESVILSGNNLPKTAGYIISKLLCSRGKITDFVFTENCLGDVGVCALAGAFSSNFSDLPLRIPLSSGMIGIGIGSLLQSKSTLISIDLSGNNIGDIGVISLCDGLKTLLLNCYNTQQKLPLKSLKLNQNRITDKGANVIAELIDRGNLRNFSEFHTTTQNNENDLKYENLNKNQYQSYNSPNRKMINNGTDWGFWVEKEDKNSKNSPKKSNLNIMNEKKDNSNFLSSTLLLEILEIGDNLLSNIGVSVILRAASSPLKNTETSNFVNGNNKNDNKKSNKKNNKFNDKNEINKSVSSENGVSDCISNIVFGTYHNPLEGILLRRLNLRNSELNLESLKNLNNFLSTCKIRKKMSRNNDVINHEFGSDSVEIEFCFTENSAGDLVDEVAKLNNFQSKNMENEMNTNGFVLTEIVEEFVQIVRSSKNIVFVSLGELIPILAENSVLLTDLMENERFELENDNNYINNDNNNNDNDNDNNINDNNNDFRNILKYSLLSDINTTLELFNTIKDVVKISYVLSEFIELEITQKRKINEKKKLKKNSNLFDNKNHNLHAHKDKDIYTNKNVNENENENENESNKNALQSIMQKMNENKQSNDSSNNQYDDVISKLNGMNKFHSTENNENEFFGTNKTISVTNQVKTDYNKSPNSKSKTKNSTKSSYEDKDANINNFVHEKFQRGRTKERENSENGDLLIGEKGSNGFEKLEIDVVSCKERGRERSSERGSERGRSREKVFNDLETKNKFYSPSPRSIESRSTMQSNKSENKNRNKLSLNEQNNELTNHRIEFEKLKHDHSVSLFLFLFLVNEFVCFFGLISTD